MEPDLKTWLEGLEQDLAQPEGSLERLDAMLRLAPLWAEETGAWQELGRAIDASLGDRMA